MSDAIWLVVTTNSTTKGKVHVQRDNGRALCGAGEFDWSWEDDVEVVDCSRCLRRLSGRGHR